MNKLCRHLENIMIGCNVKYFFIDTICTGNCLLNGVDRVSRVPFRHKTLVHTGCQVVIVTTFGHTDMLIESRSAEQDIWS